MIPPIITPIFIVSIVSVFCVSCVRFSVSDVSIICQQVVQNQVDILTETDAVGAPEPSEVQGFQTELQETLRALQQQQDPAHTLDDDKVNALH